MSATYEKKAVIKSLCLAVHFSVVLHGFIIVILTVLSTHLHDGDFSKVVSVSEERMNISSKVAW